MYCRLSLAKQRIVKAATILYGLSSESQPNSCLVASEFVSCRKYERMQNSIHYLLIFCRVYKIFTKTKWLFICDTGTIHGLLISTKALR